MSSGMRDAYGGRMFSAQKGYEVGKDDSTKCWCAGRWKGDSPHHPQCPGGAPGEREAPRCATCGDRGFICPVCGEPGGHAFDPATPCPDCSLEGPGSPDDGDVLSEEEWVNLLQRYENLVAHSDWSPTLPAVNRLRDHDLALRQRLRDAELNVAALSSSLDAENRAKLAAEERERRLRSAVESVCDEYGDDGWARTAMVRRLRTALRGEEHEDG